jgi:hypothetical protein
LFRASCFGFRISRTTSRLLATALLSAFLGCDSGTSSVNGTVSLDGQPVKSGSIKFENTETGHQEGAVIQDGKFQAKLPSGKYRLELTGQKVVGQRKQKDFEGKDEVVPITDELFPEKFNTSSQLIEEIKPGSQTLPLDLKSK